MKKATKEFLEQNGFMYENRDDGFRYNTQGCSTYKCYKQCYSRKYTSFEISFYLVPQLDHRFSKTKTVYKMKTKAETKLYNESYRYYKDCVFFKMRDVEISYRRYDAPESPYNLQSKSGTITYAGISKLRELHKKYCPTMRKGNWKHLSIKQLEKIIEEFDRYDKAIILALKKKRVKAKVAEIEKDF